MSKINMMTLIVAAVVLASPHAFAGGVEAESVEQIATLKNVGVIGGRDATLDVNRIQGDVKAKSIKQTADIKNVGVISGRDAKLSVNTISSK